MSEFHVKPSREIGTLIEIMAALRTPGTGCPWDLEQTFATIAPYTIEEAYEVADAIARADLEDLRDELGDLLLQVVFHARMAAEQGAFDFGDAVRGRARSRPCALASRRLPAPCSCNTRPPRSASIGASPGPYWRKSARRPTR
jgi:NTP pyrophosphatase (non-canonical NTP hydrolase)